MWVQELKSGCFPHGPWEVRREGKEGRGTGLMSFKGTAEMTQFSSTRLYFLEVPLPANNAIL